MIELRTFNPKTWVWFPVGVQLLDTGIWMSGLVSGLQNLVGWFDSSNAL